MLNSHILVRAVMKKYKIWIGLSNLPIQGLNDIGAKLEQVASDTVNTLNSTFQKVVQAGTGTKDMLQQYANNKTYRDKGMDDFKNQTQKLTDAVEDISKVPSKIIGAITKPSDFAHGSLLSPLETEPMVFENFIPGQPDRVRLP